MYSCTWNSLFLYYYLLIIVLFSKGTTVNLVLPYALLLLSGKAVSSLNFSFSTQPQNGSGAWELPYQELKSLQVFAGRRTLSENIFSVSDKMSPPLFCLRMNANGRQTRPQAWLFQTPQGWVGVLPWHLYIGQLSCATEQDLLTTGKLSLLLKLILACLFYV